MFRSASRALRCNSTNILLRTSFGPYQARSSTSTRSSVLVAPQSAGKAFAFSSSSLRSSEAGQTKKEDSSQSETDRKPEAEAFNVDGKQDGDAKNGAVSEAADEKTEFEKTLKEKDARIKELQVRKMSKAQSKDHEKLSARREPTAKDSLLYGKADLQNLQRRSEQEKAQMRDFAITKLAKDLTSSLDILALALKSVPEALRTPAPELEATDPRRAVADLYSGVDLTSKSLIDMLRTHGIVQFDPTGEKFDPAQHEALYQAPVPGKEPGTVLECSKAGYKIKDRILRAAQVGVVQESS